MLLFFFRPHVYAPPPPVTEVATPIRMIAGITTSIRT